MEPNTANTQMNTMGAPITVWELSRSILLNVVVGLYHDPVRVILDRIRLGLPLVVPFGISRQRVRDREQMRKRQPHPQEMVDVHVAIDVRDWDGMGARFGFNCGRSISCDDHPTRRPSDQTPNDEVALANCEVEMNGGLCVVSPMLGG